MGGGHYYSYLRPDGRIWLKFDDERVTREDERAALEANFGERRFPLIDFLSS